MSEKIRVMSDLHLEFQKSNISGIWTPSEADSEQILVLAGDIDVGQNGTHYITELCSHFKAVVRIAGNHEFYDREYHTVINFWKSFEESSAPHNFHFLHNDSRTIDGVKIIGGTMWTSFANGDPLVMRAAQLEMNDYYVIQHSGTALTPAHVLEKHLEFTQYLDNELTKPTSVPIVVVTHHSPGNPVRRSNYTSGNHMYYADLEQKVGNSEIKLWIHGHTHSSQDYMINNTRVVCNPYGYKGHELNPNFDKNLVVEV